MKSCFIFLAAIMSSVVFSACRMRTAGKISESQTKFRSQYCNPEDGYRRRTEILQRLGIDRAVIPKAAGDREPIEWALMCIRNTTAAYGLAYQNDPSLYWPGIAAIAVTDIGNTLDEIRDYKMGHRDRPVFDPGFGTGPVVSSIADHRLAERLAAGNLAVFKDIFWQYNTIQECGIEALMAMQRYDLSRNIPGEKQYRDLIPQYLEAWTLQKNGERLESLLKIAFIEQKYILQPILYDDLLPQTMGFFAAPLAMPPIRENGAGLASFMDHVQKENLTASISNFESRWSWMRELLIGMMHYIDANPRYLNQRINEIVERRDREMLKYPLKDRPPLGQSPFQVYD